MFRVNGSAPKSKTSNRNRKKRTLVAFTGGGTAGHIIPGFAVIDELRINGWEVFWIGSRRLAEKELVLSERIEFYGIPAGKLRRYFSVKNFIDLFLFIVGFGVSFYILCRLRPAVLFAKGSYVSVPPVLSAKILKIPIITHESDLTPALATRINAKFAKMIIVSFDITKDLFPIHLRSKIVVAGNPLRKDVTKGRSSRGRSRFNIPENSPLLVVTGGSTGAHAVNNLVLKALPELIKEWFIIHQTGTTWRIPQLSPEIRKRYHSLPFIYQGFPDLICAADIVLCRAGANTLGELAAIGVPAILVPLSKAQSRGEQVANAKFYTNNDAAFLIPEGDTGVKKLVSIMGEIGKNSDKRLLMAENIKKLATPNAAKIIAQFIRDIGK